MIVHPQTETRVAQRSLLALLLFGVLCVSSVACVKRSRSVSASANDRPTAQTQTAARININKASAKELEALPDIGEELAQRIVEHRRKHGPFRRIEDLMMVRGISDKRFSAIRDLISVE